MPIYDAAMRVRRGGHAAGRARRQGVRLGLVARLGGEGHEPARRARGDRAVLRAHPPLQPRRDGRPAAPVRRRRVGRVARADRRGGVLDHRDRERRGARRCTVRAGDKEFTARVRIDTPKEVQYFQHGGILPFVLRQLLEKDGACSRSRRSRGALVAGPPPPLEPTAAAPIVIAGQPMSRGHLRHWADIARRLPSLKPARAAGGGGTSSDSAGSRAEARELGVNVRSTEVEQDVPGTARGGVPERAGVPALPAPAAGRRPTDVRLPRPDRTCSHSGCAIWCHRGRHHARRGARAASTPTSPRSGASWRARLCSLVALRPRASPRRAAGMQPRPRRRRGPRTAASRRSGTRRPRG